MAKLELAFFHLHSALDETRDYCTILLCNTSAVKIKHRIPEPRFEALRDGLTLALNDSNEVDLFI